ncbi:thioredoxin family protein [Secundilactobacillus paracollinoides]|uniref:Thiol reductase thioredoxin n=1 Tax=Secundilactobacillus paracollinoides TaxID=240427 RepID=A0A1B2J1E9_9LACO|nr:thioredoxin family protein [Secundilactobacillus paracollinoides]ANZ62207.1 thiol reductase thioredoxin [Secundilactobacillus paracollinoides]ANZ68154.1 thiol reductase thioredoxin [Secundilactobacillus paracollinoides]
MEQLPKMTTEELTKRVSDGKYMLFFSAGWCPDCAFIKPAMPDIEKKFSDYTFLAVDRDENIDLCVDLNVLGIPSFIAYDHGQEIGRFVNKDRKTKEQVEAFVTAL